MRPTLRLRFAAGFAAFALIGCSSSGAPADGTVDVPEPSGATEEAPSDATEAAPETEAAPRS